MLCRCASGSLHLCGEYRLSMGTGRFRLCDFQAATCTDQSSISVEQVASLQDRVF